MMRNPAMTLLCGLLCAVCTSAAILSLENGEERMVFDTRDLPALPDARVIQIPAGYKYSARASHRAILLSALLSRMPPSGGHTLEAVARDGYAAQIPM